MALLHIHLLFTSPHWEPPPDRLPLGSEWTGSRTTRALVSSTTEATQSLLNWTEGKLAFTSTPARSDGLPNNAWSDLKSHSS